MEIEDYLEKKKSVNNLDKSIEDAIKHLGQATSFIPTKLGVYYDTSNN